MTYVIFKHSLKPKHTVIVTDSEGIGLEYDTYDDAKFIADLFKANTTHDSTYEVITIN